VTRTALVIAPSTMLRMVPLPRRFATGEEPPSPAYVAPKRMVAAILALNPSSKVGAPLAAFK
jgi:hypothetical protein